MTENEHGVPAVEAAMPAPVRESDNPVMKGLLFLRSSAASAPSLTRGLWQCYGRERAAAARNFLGQYRPHPALYLTLALAVFGAVTFAQTHSLATGVVVNGEYVGAVESRDVFQSARLSSRPPPATRWAMNTILKTSPCAPVPPSWPTRIC